MIHSFISSGANTAIAYISQRVGQNPERRKDLLPTILPDTFILQHSQILSLDRSPRKRLRRKRQSDKRLDGLHTKALEHLMQLLGGLATAASAVAHDHPGLSLPFMVEIVDGVLDARRIAPVVLRGDKDECRMRGNLLGPLPGQLVRVFLRRVEERWDARFVVQGEIPGREIDQTQVGGRVCFLDGLQDELGDLLLGLM